MLKAFSLLITVFFVCVCPNCVYGDGLPPILIQGTFSVASGLKEHPSVSFSFCRLADGRAANTHSYCWCVAGDGGDCALSWAFHTHEIGTGALCQALLLVFPLLLWRGMKDNLCERHVLVGRSSPPERSSYNFIKSRIEGFSVCYFDCITQHVGF